MPSPGRKLTRYVSQEWLYPPLDSKLRQATMSAAVFSLVSLHACQQQHRNENATISIVSTLHVCALLLSPAQISTIVGGGVLSLPFTFANAGILLGCVLPHAIRESHQFPFLTDCNCESLVFVCRVDCLSMRR